MKKLSCILLVLIITIRCFSQQSNRLLTIGDEAPEFKVAYWLKGEPGKGIEKGKVNVVEFWATWCAPCLAGVPHLSKLAEAYKDQGVKVFGISISERKRVDADLLKRFIITPKGKEMHYIVGADDSTKYMATYWQGATGQRGIPFAMIVDQNGKIAWMGHPMLMDKPLEKIVNGTWDIKAEQLKFIEDKRLDSVDVSIISQFNAYTNPAKCSIGLLAIDSLLKKEPQLKYRQFTAHYTFVFLLNTNPIKAVEFARATWAANEIPHWNRVSDMVLYVQSKQMKMPPSVYQLGIDALQEQLDHYPWSMNFPVTYDEMASLASLTGDTMKAIEYETKSIESCKNDSKMTVEQLAKFQNNLNKYMSK